MHYSVKFDAYIFIQSRATDIFFISHKPKNPRWYQPASCVLRLWIWPFWHVDSVKFEICTKFGSNICYSNWDRRTYALRRSFDDVTQINFRFRRLVTWSSAHGRDASSCKIWCRYIYPMWSYWHFAEIKDGGRRHLGFVGREPWDHPQRHIRGAYSL